MEVTAIKLSVENVLVKSRNESILNDKYKFEDGFFILDKNNSNLSVYTTRLDKLSLMDKKVLHCLDKLDVQIDANIGQYKNEVDSLWINIGKNYSMFYPQINVSEELQSTLDPSEHRYYFLADSINNPSKENIFIELFNDRLSYIPSTIVPVSD